MTFAASIVTFAWRGVDTMLLSAVGSGDTLDLDRFLLGMPTAWATTGVLLALVSAVLYSIIFFWKVMPSLPSNPRSLIFVV